MHRLCLQTIFLAISLLLTIVFPLSTKAEYSKAGYSKVPFQIRNTSHLITVTVQIGGHDYAFVVDTAAGTTCIDLKHEPQIDFVAQTHGPVALAAGIGTMNQSLQLGRLPSLQLGTVTFQNVPACKTDLSTLNQAFRLTKENRIDGILGSDFLKKHDAIISYPEHLLFLKPE